MDDHERVEDLSMDEAMRFLANAIEHTLQEMFHERRYFLLLTGNFGSKDREASFVSNGRREDSIAALEELLGRIKSRSYMPPTVGNA